MSKIKIIVTGASGMLGRALHRLLLLEFGEYAVVGTGLSRLQVSHAGSTEQQLERLDLLDHEATSRFLQCHQPDVVCHCAAQRYSFPDAFEKRPDESIRLNVESTRHLAEECKKLNSVLVYISTSYVFDGGAVSRVLPPYKPNDSTNPINNYGKSKLDGECAVNEVLNTNCDGSRKGIIVRVPLLYGEDCTDLAESPALEMLKAFLPKDQNCGVKKGIDNWALRFPTSCEDVARVLKEMIDRRVTGDTYHVSSPHGMTKYDLMKLQCNILGISPETVDELTAPNSAGPPTGSAPRPQCTQLDCSETWKSVPAYTFRTLEQGMKQALDGFPRRFIASPS
ncbi:hypothetical protein THAOC_01851 [Thalassiosira oceanica]|uniref:RmlD-like substrate binding domain-containing protein n=1 Tax=Thalassiosira oceanica TaxID=159749 RepID=K0TG72_THAOC|nr:hypothetical protein THAOC_01851 [Thalassiosira oceanica]|eukprot:EJK76390.1 hypothetical protein THAOC_01851 [Thalassiosira oceanica]